MGGDRRLYLRQGHGAPRTARNFVRTVVADWRLHAQEEAIVLVCHELVANAMVHARSAVVLSLTLHRRRLIIAVADDDPTAPRASETVDTEQTSGRGLYIVGELSRRWGVRALSAGKVVWAELATGLQPVLRGPVRPMMALSTV